MWVNVLAGWIVFKHPGDRNLILSGKKTAYRRASIWYAESRPEEGRGFAGGVQPIRELHVKRAKEFADALKPGMILSCLPNVNEPPFARIQISKVYTQRLGQMIAADAKKEGEYTLQEFKKAWIDVNPKIGWNPSVEVSVVEFNLYEILKGNLK